MTEKLNDSSILTSYSMEAEISITNNSTFFLGTKITIH